MNLQASLFYYLHNHRLVSFPRLVNSLHYQSERSLERSMSFVQVLIAFDDLHHLALQYISEFQPDLDPEPIGHLLLDQGQIQLKDLLEAKLQAELQDTYLGQCLLEQKALQADQLGQLLAGLQQQHELALKGKISILYLLKKRQQAMQIFKRRLWMRQYLSQEQMSQYGLWKWEYLPLEFKPLLDLLILNADFPDYLLPVMMIENVPFEKEPVFELLATQGHPQMSAKLRKRLHTVLAPNKNPCLLLVETGLFSREELSGLILSAVHQRLQQQFFQKASLVSA